jgi:hypothetical protein
MMEAARTSETLVNFYQTTRCYNPEDSHLHDYLIVTTAGRPAPSPHQIFWANTAQYEEEPHPVSSSRMRKSVLTRHPYAFMSWCLSTGITSFLFHDKPSNFPEIESLRKLALCVGLSSFLSLVTQCEMNRLSDSL